MNWRLLLYPVTLLYGGITNLRNKLFDWQVLSSQQYDLPVISVGNITVGGTGKTPLSEYIIGLLQDEHQVALLSRGYKRQTKGALIAQSDSTVGEIGDEPFQMLRKFPQLKGAVAEKRVEGMDLLLSQIKPDVILLDDAYQHRYVKPGLSLLVIDYNRPLWNDYPFPAGNLRETRAGQKRADLIVVNKCPAGMTLSEKSDWIKKINPLDHQQVFFSSIGYGDPIAMVMSNAQPAQCSSAKIIGLAGIARPEVFFSYLNTQFNVRETLVFPDHHNFTSSDVTRIITAFDAQGADAILFTTEKDAVRLNELETLPDELKKRICYIPIELQILFDEATIFDKLITDYVGNNQRNS
ncbi:MAG: tetraacyldisaccharide 4'-kinase [Marinilabiliaceae bacterium]|nr:tetraacyldisaccharide 4'-kinase [Marinilabiliaceae bacterium]